ncbi:unnamed protein product [Symbiodinium sp. CCMP2592]|nr:unnamed protein product [Symbiodinium sp. CCMP2592]
MHGWMVMWAGKFAEAATRLAHWIEGCFCREHILVSQMPASKRRKTMMEESGSGTCCWKGKRLPELACGKMTDLIQYFTSQARTEYISEMLAAPADVRARLTAIDALATEQLRVVLEQKFAYAQTIPWVVCAAFGAYTGIPWDRSKVTTGGAFADAVSFRAFSGQMLESRQLKAVADSELPLHHYAEAWTMVQEYSFCSLAERGAERQHSEIRNAARRGQRYAGPAVVASRKREKQVVAMIGDPQQLQFLVAHWRDRQIWEHLLEHCLPKQTVRRMTVVQRLAKVYAYHPDEHFMDVSEEATAQAVYQGVAGCFGCCPHGRLRAVEAGPSQIVHFLKSHLQNGSLVSLGEEAFQLALRYTPKQPEEEADVPAVSGLVAELANRNGSASSFLGSVLFHGAGCSTRAAEGCSGGAGRQPDLVPIPDFIQDHAKEDLLHELLRHGALGGRHVSVDDLSDFNAAAVQRLQQHGILSGEEGAFGDLTLSIASSLQLLPECTWSELLSIWELSHFFLTRGKVALTSKTEYFRLLFKQGWKPRCDDESEFFEWHCRDATAELPAQGLGMSLPYLRCLLTSVLLWQKPGNLQRILVNGPSKYYEYLMSSVDLSAVAKLTAEACIRLRWRCLGRQRNCSRAHTRVHGANCFHTHDFTCLLDFHA